MAVSRCRARWLIGMVAMLLAVATVRLVAQVQLPKIQVQGKTACEIHPETAAATADLWLAAHEALLGASSSAEAPRLLVQEWRRELDQKFRLRWERRDTSRVTTRHPFEKPLPANLERVGYIQTRAGATVYYGPDAGLLLSEWFLRRHCFQRIDGSGATVGLVGLGFAPLASTDRSDVAGVLWVDLERGELRQVEYAWTNAPDYARLPGVGGRADFVRLKSGGWIIQRWSIRMPRRADSWGGVFDGYTDQGGEVLAVIGEPTRKP